MTNIEIKMKNEQGEFIKLENSDLSALSSLSQITPDPSGINYGAIANSGSLTIIDGDGEIAKQIDDGVIDDSNIDIEIYLNGNKIQQHISNDSDYDTDNVELNIPLTNSMQDLDTLIYKGYVYQDKEESLLVVLFDVMKGLIPKLMSLKLFFETNYGQIMGEKSNDEETTVKAVLDAVSGTYFEGVVGSYIWYRTNLNNLYASVIGTDATELSVIEKMNQIMFAMGYTDVDYSSSVLFEDLLSNVICVTDLDGVDSEYSVYDYLNLIKVQYPSIEYGSSYRQILDDICSIAQLNLFKDNDDNYKFVSARPISFVKPIMVTKDSMYSPLKYTKIIKNKFDGVEMSEMSVEDTIDYDTVVSNQKTLLETKDISEYTSEEKNGSGVVNGVLASTGFNYVIGSYIKSKYYYYNDKITIPKKSSNNLSQILKINEWDSKKNTYSIQFNKTQHSATGIINWDKDEGDVILSGNPTISSTIEKTETIIEQGLITDTNMFSYTVVDGTIKYEKIVKSTTTPDEPIVVISEDDNNYYIEYTICVSKDILNLGGYGRYGNTTVNLDLDATGKYFEYRPLYLDISFYGNKRTIKFDSISASSEYIETAKTKASVNGGRLLQTGTTFNEQKMSDIIKNNITTDYSNGVKSGSLTVCGYDFNYEDGRYAKKWNNGEIINPEDVVSVEYDTDKDGNKRYWQVTGRTFNYDGEPLCPLEIREVKAKSVYGLYKNGKLTYSWDAMVRDGIINVLETSKAVNAVNKNLIDGDLFVPPEILVIRQFDGCGLLRSVVMYEHTFMMSNCFKDCYGLESIEFLDSDVETNSIEYISRNCFSGCSKLKTITLPDRYVQISSGAFNNCIRLESIHIGSGLYEVEANTVTGCTALKQVTFKYQKNWVKYTETSSNPVSVENPVDNVELLKSLTTDYDYLQNTDLYPTEE